MSLNLSICTRHLRQVLSNSLRSLTTVSSPECDAEIAVIGAGVVGLAVARHFASSGREVILIDAAARAGTGTSSRNSEVIHAGIYYPPESIKARTCVSGRKNLYTYCMEHDVPYRQISKLIVAVGPEQIPKLKALHQAANVNGVTDLQWLTAEEARAMEPEVRCAAALLSPSTGIIDSHTYMASLQREIEVCGGTVAFNSRVEHGDVSGAVKRLHVKDVGSGEGTTLRVQSVVNCAGLYAQRIAHTLQGLPVASIPPLWIAKGSYFAAGGTPGAGQGSPSTPPFSRLVYPLPERGGLGIHLTLDLAGALRFGPDVEWLPDGTDPDTIDYSVDHAKGKLFEDAVRLFWPGLPAGSLEPAYSGVRPKVVGPGPGPPGDFVVSGPSSHGVPGVVNLFGIESPGLTASLALADEVERALNN